MCLFGYSVLYLASLWWKDLSGVILRQPGMDDWFLTLVNHELGCGRGIRFWRYSSIIKSLWLGIVHIFLSLLVVVPGLPFWCSPSWRYSFLFRATFDSTSVWFSDGGSESGR
jgi:hypothetical protein